MSAYGYKAIETALKHGKALLKYISANDVGKTGSHQYGYFLPKGAWKLFTPHPPTKGTKEEHFVQVLWQDGRITNSCVHWYGKKTRSEYRLTRFQREFPYLGDDSIGSLLVLVPEKRDYFHCFVLDDEDDIEELQAALGVEVIESWATYGLVLAVERPSSDICLDEHIRSIASELKQFPTTKRMSQYVAAISEVCIPSLISESLDNRLLQLYELEHRLFRVVERKLCGNDIVRVFKDVDDFVKTASTIMNRRKARAGRALENHVQHLLNSTPLRYEANPRIGSVPDILIPGAKEYVDSSYPTDRLVMLGIKTTCKDRWRQVLNEAKRIPHKHLLTLQEGVSTKQLDQMQEANLTLVVPKRLQSKYPKSHRADLMSLEDFVSYAIRKTG